MRRLHINARNPLAELSGIVFLAQCFDELLFDHSDDSYKAGALNTFSRIGEFAAHSHVVVGANLGHGVLKPYLEELEWSIKNDPVLNGPLSDLATTQLAAISSNLHQPARLAPLAYSLTVISEKYFSLIKEKLLHLVLNEPNKKGEIHALAQAFCTQVEMEGFNRRYAYFVTQRYLVSRLARDWKLNVKNVIEKFFSCFDAPNQKWSVFLLGEVGFGDFEKYGAPFGLTISQTPPSFIWPGAITKQFTDRKTEHLVYLTFSEVPARDAIKAREIAEWSLNTFIGCIRFLCHDRVFAVESEALVEEPVKGMCVPVGKSPDPMQIGRGSNKAVPDKQLIQLNEVVQGQHLVDSSTRRYVNAIAYHKAALETSLPENQLVDLWAALEGLLPTPHEDSSRINFFVANLLAPLTLTYTEKLFRRVSEELHAEPTDIQEIVNSISGECYLEKVTNLIVSSECDQNRKTLAAKLDRNPLLRYRTYQLWEKFHSRKAIFRSLQEHRKKVRWHIHRIYSTRNAIVHSAESFPYLPTIVENLHTYLDTLLSSLARTAVSSNLSISIEVILEIFLAHEALRFTELQEKKDDADEECGLATSIKFVFGDGNILKPAEFAPT